MVRGNSIGARLPAAGDRGRGAYNQNEVRPLSHNTVTDHEDAADSALGNMSSNNSAATPRASSPTPTLTSASHAGSAVREDATALGVLSPHHNSDQTGNIEQASSTCIYVVYACALCGPSRAPSEKRNNVEQHIWHNHSDRCSTGGHIGIAGIDIGYPTTDTPSTENPARLAPNVPYRAVQHKHLVAPFVVETYVTEEEFHETVRRRSRASASTSRGRIHKLGGVGGIKRHVIQPATPRLLPSHGIITNLARAHAAVASHELRHHQHHDEHARHSAARPTCTDYGHTLGLRVSGSTPLVQPYVTNGAPGIRGPSHAGRAAARRISSRSESQCGSGGPLEVHSYGDTMSSHGLDRAAPDSRRRRARVIQIGRSYSDIDPLRRAAMQTSAMPANRDTYSDSHVTLGSSSTSSTSAGTRLRDHADGPEQFSKFPPGPTSAGSEANLLRQYGHLPAVDCGRKVRL